MELNFLGTKAGITSSNLENEGFTKIMRSLYLSQDEIASKIGFFYGKAPLENLVRCRIERRIRHYNLHIEGQKFNCVSFATLQEVQEAASKISDAASKKGKDITVKVGCMKVNLMEALPLPDWDKCDGCLAMLLWPLFAIVYYTVFPIANIILRMFIK